MKYLLIIHGRLDNLNDYIGACRKNAYVGARVKVKNEAIVLSEISQQLRGLKINNPVVVNYSWYEVNKRRDLDNISSFGRKVIQDALVKSGVLNNDGWRDIVGFSDRFFEDKENPRIIVEIEEVEGMIKE